MDRLIWPLILLGHVGSWCFFFNRAHATGCSRTWRKAIEKLVLAAVFLPLALWLVGMYRAGWPGPQALLGRNSLLAAYGMFCGIAGLGLFAAWLIRQSGRRTPDRVRFLNREVVDLEQLAGQRLTAGWFAQLLRLVPGNRCTWMEFSLGELVLARPDASRWEGLKIAHLSDFHLTGGLRQEFFEAIVERVNREACDLVLLSGDLVDENSCLDWIPAVFGRLQARLGKYYVFGNHDLNVTDQVDFRNRLQAAGCGYLTGIWQTVDFGMAPIALTGNDLPWYRGAETLAAAAPAEALRICVAHSPDQLAWAGARNVELMFAGHTHGGQICFPLIGPVISPSKYGVRYAGGEFQLGSMLLLVSRGISGDEPIRWNCLPQVNVWTVRVAGGPAGVSAGPAVDDNRKERGMK